MHLYSLPLPETSPCSAHSICRGGLGLSQYLLSVVCILGGAAQGTAPSHTAAARDENSRVFSSLNSEVPLLSTWTIRSEFSKALYLGKFRQISSKVAESTPVSHKPSFCCFSRSGCTTQKKCGIKKKNKILFKYTQKLISPSILFSKM